MARQGYIYLITNKLNNMKYVGQTSRDIETRFYEHCTEARGRSKLHRAIQKYGWQNFSVKELECVDIEKLDEREQYWIKYYGTYDNGYNLTLGGCNVNFNSPHYKHIQIIENNLIIDSKEYLIRLMSQVTSWSSTHLNTLITKAIRENKDFLGYHIRYIKIPNMDYISDNDCIVDWIKTLNIRFSGKRIFCLELEKEFETIGSAAQFLVENNYYSGSSKTPVQSLVTSIGKQLSEKTDFVDSAIGPLHFIYLPGTTKNTDDDFTEKKVYCPQIDKTFESQTAAAKYFLNSNIWTGIKEKTARLKISDVVRGAFSDYKGYTFQAVED